jgi:hypothetical protein
VNELTERSGYLFKQIGKSERCANAHRLGVILSLRCCLSLSSIHSLSHGKYRQLILKSIKFLLFILKYIKMLTLFLLISQSKISQFVTE